MRLDFRPDVSYTWVGNGAEGGLTMYIYGADVWCDECGLAIRERILAAGEGPNDPSDETTYDSGEFPKGPYPDDDESDTPQHCAADDDECPNAETLADGTKISHFFRNQLTETGVEYVREYIRDDSGSLVVQLWQAEYEQYYDLHV